MTTLETTATLEDITEALEAIEIYEKQSTNTESQVDDLADALGSITLNKKTAPTETMNDIVLKLIPALMKRIRQYHELFTQPLIAEFWEETLHNAFADSGFSTTWKADRSHKVGEDMRIENMPNSRISCKSGQLTTPRKGSPSVKFNGSRTTSQESIADKIAHLSADHDDWYFVLAKKKPFDKTYRLLIFESSVCKVNKLTWAENDSGKQWIGVGDFQASINKSMSSQLWTTLPMDMVTYKYDIVV